MNTARAKTDSLTVMRRDRLVFILSLMVRVNYEQGICYELDKIRNSDIITKQERVFVRRYLYANKPTVKDPKSTHWWPRGEATPRVKFLSDLVVNEAKRLANSEYIQLY